VHPRHASLRVPHHCHPARSKVTHSRLRWCVCVVRACVRVRVCVCACGVSLLTHRA
jgi:hypothetical protein